MAIIEVTVCDVCRNPERKTTQFHIAEDLVGHTLDLCRDHAAPLRDLLKHGTATTPTKGVQSRVAASKAPIVRRRRSGFDAAVATMEEIEAGKRA